MKNLVLLLIVFVGFTATAEEIDLANIREQIVRRQLQMSRDSEARDLNSDVFHLVTSMRMHESLLNIRFHWGKADLGPEYYRAFCFDVATLGARISKFILETKPGAGEWARDDLKKVIVGLAGLMRFCKFESAPDYGLYTEIRTVMKPGEMPDIPMPKDQDDLIKNLAAISRGFSDLSISRP